MANKNIRKYSMDDIKVMHKHGDYVPTGAHAPIFEIDEEFWQNARVVNPPPQRGAFARRLAWFKAESKWHIKRMNAALTKLGH